MRRWLPKALLAAALLAAFTLPGCSDEPAGLPEGAVKIRFWHSMSGPLGQALKHLISKFRAEHPDIYVQAIFQGGYGQLTQKVNLALMDGSPPDLAQAYEAQIGFYNRVEENILPLDDFIAAAEDFDYEDIFPAFRSTVTQDGKVYSLPPTKSFPVLYYNIDAFEEAGLPGPPKTWEELREYGRKLTRDEDGDGDVDRWGWAFVNDPWILECMILQRGGAFLDDEGNSALGGVAARDALRFLLEAATGDQPYAYRTTGYDHQTDFARGDVAMIIGSSVSRTFMRDQITFRMGAAPIPQGERKASIMAGPNIAVFKTGDPRREKAAFEFLKFFIETQSTLFWGLATNYVPVRKSAVASADYQRRLETDPGLSAPVDQLAYASSEPPLPGWYNCRQVLGNLIQTVFQDPDQLDSMVDAAVDRMNRILADAREDAARRKAGS